MEIIVMDSLSITNRFTPSGYPPGVVVVFEWTERDELLPVVGEQVSVHLPDGREMTSTVGEIKCHGSGRSFYFAGCTQVDAPVGTTISWVPRPVGPRVVDDLGRLLVAPATAQPAGRSAFGRVDSD